MSKRVMAGGVADLAGQTINGLKVSDIVSRNPAIRWGVTCLRCGAISTESHTRLTNGAAACKNTGCGKDAIREYMADTPRKAAARERAEAEAKRRERDERTTAQIEEAQQTFNDAYRKIHSTVRERITTQKDDELYIDPATVGITMSRDEARRFNGEQSALFASQNPSYYATPANFQNIADYLSRNNVQIVSALTLKAAVERLDAYGLIEHRPASPVAASAPVNLSVERSEQPQSSAAPETFKGIDPETGREREFTAREVDRMPSDEYRRIFHVRKSFPTHAAF